MTLRQIEDRLPEAAKDLKLNLQNVLTQGALSPAQRFGVAIACAIAARSPGLRTALEAAAREQAVPDAVFEDGLAAASLMGMNNVFYRFKHMIEKPEYATKSARLRMNRLVRPATNRTDFELFCLAVSAVNGCESCVRAHEKTVLEGGLSEDHVHDAIRTAATVHGVAVALDALPVALADAPTLAVAAAAAD